MMKSGLMPSPRAPRGSETDAAAILKKRIRPAVNKRAHSLNPPIGRPRSPFAKAAATDRRCQSLSPSMEQSRKSIERMPSADTAVSTPETQPSSLSDHTDLDQEKAAIQAMSGKIARSVAAKKREFLKLKKALIPQQNAVIELYAVLRETEARIGTKDDTLGDLRVVSVTGWPPHDLLMLLREDLELPLNPDVTGVFRFWRIESTDCPTKKIKPSDDSGLPFRSRSSIGSRSMWKSIISLSRRFLSHLLGLQILQQLSAQLNQIPEEVLGVGAELMARRIELLNLIRAKYRNNAKCAEWDTDTEKLHRLLAGIAENLKSKVNYCIDLAKIPWLDREAMIKKIDRIQKDNLILQHKLDELSKKEGEELKERVLEGSAAYHKVLEDLTKERCARESLKEVVSTAESMLRVARGRIATLERQLKETRADLDASRRKHKDLEQLYRHRETSYDARSKKLIEVSKNGEMAIETLSRQRDALELRVKELREQADLAEKAAAMRDAEQRARADSLQAKLAEQEKCRALAESRIPGYEVRIKELEEQLQIYRERSAKLVDIERKRCVEFLPSIETEPTDRETDIWKELQCTRAALARTEEELRQSRADKDSFFNSLNKIAQGEGDDTLQDKMATELLEREKRITKLQNVIQQLKENEKIAEQSIAQYESKLTSLRLEVKRLRNYSCYSKEIPYQELQTELLDLHMQVDTLTRERSALVTAAASRALMLERHERAASLFARILKARRDLSALLEGGGTESATLSIDENCHAEVSRSLSSVCASAADTWTALQAERTRVLRLESAVLAQSLQLEREGRVRTQLERRRALLEREILRTRHSSSAEHCASRKNLNWSFNNSAV